MSLLLDALQRASKEKEKSAAASSDGKAGYPSIELEPLPLPPPPAVPTTVPEPSAGSQGKPATPPQAKAPLALAEHPPASPVAPAPSTPLPEAKTPSASSVSEPLAPTKTTGTSSARPPESATIQAARPSPRVAQEILSAGTPPREHSGGRGKSGRRGMWLLGAIALVLALAVGSLFLGVWDTAPDRMEVRRPPAASPSSTNVASPDSTGKTPTVALPSVPAVEEKAVPPSPVREDNVRAVPTRPDSPPKQWSDKPKNSNDDPVFRKHPDNRSVLDNAYAALSAGRLDDAAIAYRQALRDSPEERDALLGLAHIAHRQGHRDEARAFYRQVLRQDPENPAASAGLLALLSAGSSEDLQDAGLHARELAERNPESAAAFATLGGILARQGRIADAQQAFFRAFALEPGSELHAYNLAVALDRLHKYDLAQSYYERAIALGEKNAHHDFSLQVARSRLDQLRARNREESPAP